jgi:hypothetical protein
MSDQGILVYVNDAGGGRVHAYIGRDEENYPEEGWYRLVPAQVEPHEIKGPNVIVDNLERCRHGTPHFAGSPARRRRATRATTRRTTATEIW